ncbi:MAG: hypothetical protein ACNA7T_14935 [Haliea sp.]|jgi:hypothetical protein
MPENTSPPSTAPSHPRVPCRGCTQDCPNYDSCEGKPWRIGQKPPEAVIRGINVRC